jgi:hypothetical protein
MFTLVATRRQHQQRYDHRVVMKWTPPADAASSCQAETALLKAKGSPKEHTTIAVDVAKSVFQVALWSANTPVRVGRQVVS